MNRSSDVIELEDAASPGPRVGQERSIAFGKLVDEHLADAYRLARAILRDPIEAEDATHDAFVRAWRSWPTLRDPARFEAWFDRIVVNTCRNRIRASQRRPTDISDEVALATGDAYGQAEDRDLLGAAIARLSPDHQIVVALRFYRDLSVNGIASRLGIPAGTVRSRLHYALRQLQDAIDTGQSKGPIR